MEEEPKNLKRAPFLFIFSFGVRLGDDEIRKGGACDFKSHQYMVTIVTPFQQEKK